MKYKVVITDDHTLVASAIRSMIERFDNFEVLFEARNGRQLLNQLSECAIFPDIILLDIDMPIMNGFEAMKELRIQYPNAKVLCLSMMDDEKSSLQMITAGANGFISKIAKEDELKSAMDSVMEKGYYYTDSLTHSLFTNMRSIAEEKVALSDREKELLSFICSEKTYQEIADVMCLSPKTIDGYRNSLFQKLNVKSRVGLAMFAVKEGYFEIP